VAGALGAGAWPKTFGLLKNSKTLRPRPRFFG